MSEDYIIKKLKNTKIKYCIGRIFSTTNKDQKKNYLIPDLKIKIKKQKNNIVLKNLNHYRDFISLKELSKILFKLYKIKFKGILNLGSGKQIHLKDIAKFIAKKYNKKIEFEDNIRTTHLIANNNNLKKIYKIKNFESVFKNIF